MIAALKSAGFKVVQTTCRADRVVEAGRSWVPQLVVLDLAENDLNQSRSMLKTLSEEPMFSHSSIVILSTRESPPPTLRFGEIGTVHIISLLASVPVFVERMKAILRMRVHPVYRCKDPLRQVIQILLTGRIGGTNGIGFVIKAPIKIANLALLEVYAPSFEDWGLSSCLFRRTTTESSLASGQDFYNEISVIGISPNSAERLCARSEVP